eukprot:m.80743 g.80743  ORF g.80743 m.80743 type:complete len:360 (-) comp16312_c0_seq1:252-1331(-)
MAKWLNKKRQAAKEMMNKESKHTAFDPEFHEMEQETDVTINALKGFVNKVPYYLHPNPAARLRTGLKKQAENRYKHAVIDIADLCTKSGSELEGDSTFGAALVKAGQSFDQIRDAHYDLDDEVNQQFLSPVKELLEKDGKEIAYHRKKLKSRRLDYDFKKNTNEENAAKGKPAKFTDADVKIAEEKFNDSFKLAESTMANLLDNDVEQVAQLASFVQAHINFYSSALQSMQDLKEYLDDKVEQGKTRQPRELTASSMQSRLASSTSSAGGAAAGTTAYDYSDDEDAAPAGAPAAAGGGDSGPRATGLYDFEAENAGELDFKAGDTIKLTQRVDENWLEGTVGGKTGIFPANYVEVIQEP